MDGGGLMEVGDKVIISGTNSVFDHKEGVILEIIEGDQDTTCLVSVDFIPEEGKKVIQNFNIENIKLIDENSSSVNDINEDVGETKVEKDNRIEKLANYLDINEDEITPSNHDDDVFVIDSEDQEWLVCDYDEAYARALDDVKEVYDDLGLEAFTPAFQEWILENAMNLDFLESATYEDISALVDDMDDEEVADECIDEGIVEAHEVYDEESDEYSPELRDDVDFYALRQKLIDKKFETIDDYKQYWIDMLGEHEFFEWIKNSDFAEVDIYAVAEECISLDGIAHFIATYDGEEVELGDDLYAYRLN